MASAPASAQDAGSWSTYRGNAQRTGNVDGVAGPGTGKILWAWKSKDHFIASPVPMGDKLFVSGLGPFNVANFFCLNTNPDNKDRVAWAKTTPFLKLPTVSSPAIFEGRLVFGEGMHQTDGASLYCLEASGGQPVWRHHVPGSLVHLEGSPTLADGKAYIGGGAAGVICFETNRANLEGKSLDLADLKKALAARWKSLQEKYLVDKKKDADFAIPPTEEQLLIASPAKLWQQGAEKWHVDAPVAVTEGKVLVASAFLDKEKVGDRALFALDAKTGAIVWRTPLKLNPWGGPAVAGGVLVVSGSSIGYDTKALKGAKGFIAAYDLADGKEKWYKDITGGVVACAALGEGLAIAAATDGKVRAFDLATGERKWIYDAKFPLFAPVALVKGVAYAGDLKGVVHAIDVSTGMAKWTLDLGTQAQAPGMVYGGPTVHAGRVFVATCNLEGPFARQTTAVFCIGEK